MLLLSLNVKSAVNYDCASSAATADNGRLVFRSIGVSSAPWPLGARFRPDKNLFEASAPFSAVWSLPNLEKKAPRLRIKLEATPPAVVGADVVDVELLACRPSSRPTSSKPSSAGGKRCSWASRDCRTLPLLPFVGFRNVDESRL